MAAAPFVIAALAAIALLVILALTFVASFRSRRALALARRLGLELDAAVAPRVVRRLATTQRLGALGGLLGTGAGVAVAAMTRLDPTTEAWLINGGLFIGLGLGLSSAALAAVPSPAPEGVRVARARETTLSDYVAAHELLSTRVLVAVAAVATLVWVLPLEPAPFFPAAPVLAALALLSALVFELGGRAITSRPTPTETVEHLAWEDALRSTALRQLLTAPLTLALVSLIWSGFGALTAAPPAVGLVVVNLAAPILMAGLVTVAVLSVASRPQRHFLRVLWPELADGAAR